MRTSIFLIIVCFLLAACNKKKHEKITIYNDKVVKYVEQSEKVMKTWNATNFMQEYTIKKQNSITKLLILQDSLIALEPLEDDDTLRMAGLSMLDNYLYAFSIYDTVYQILSDSFFYKEDSIRVQELLRSNQNMLKQQADAFVNTQKRFSERYTLQFLE